MDFSISQNQQALLAKLDIFLDTCGYDDTYFTTCALQGKPPKDYYCALAASEFGLWQDHSLETLVLLSTHMGERGFPPHLLLSVLQAEDMLSFGTKKQQEIVLSYLKTQGQECFSFAISEKKSDGVSAMQTTATHKNGKVLLQGHKAYVSNGLIAPYVMVLAAETDLPERPISMYFVPRETPGMRFVPLGGSHVDAELFLDEVLLASDALMGQQGKGFGQLLKHLEMERIAISCLCLGLSKCAYRDAVAYIGSRPAANSQLVQEKLVDMQLRLQTMELLLYQTLWKKANGQSIRNAVPMTKLYCAREGFAVADAALQLLGGAGYREDCRTYRIWKELRGQRIGGGADEVLIQNIGNQLLKQ